MYSSRGGEIVEEMVDFGDPIVDEMDDCVL